MKILALVCLGLMAFCVFGFAATFEPLERSSQLAWRIVYAAGVIASLAGLAWALKELRRRGGA